MDDLFMLKKKEIVNYFLKKDIIINVETLEKLDNSEKLNLLYDSVIKNTDDVLFLSSKENSSDILIKPKKERSPVKILFNYRELVKKREIKDFVSYFNNRYKALRSILQQRQELQSVVSVNRIIGKKEREQVAFIGMVLEKQITKNGNYILIVEDITGSIKVLISKNKPDLIAEVKDIVEDEVIGIVGASGEGIVFAQAIIHPDVPLNKEFKKSPIESYAIFTSDLHFGAKMFLKENWDKFMKWLNGEIGSEEQKKIVEKIDYVFFIGDLIEGVGIYPDQEKDLAIPDVFDQYKAFALEAQKIPKHMNIIICPGNHDAMRIAEPQPMLYKEYAQCVYDIENAIIVTNPSLVNIGAGKGFPGFDVLLYHGFSIPFLSEAVESIRQQGGQKRTDLIMKFMLQRRHLAPPHTSTQYIPDPDFDPLVIEKVPDLFVTGHVHRATAATYRNVTMLNCSTWISETDYQRKVGLTPEPARVHLVNLQTREVKIMKF